MKDLFIGFLYSAEKVPLSSVKDKSNWLECPPEQGDYCGILKKNIIQVDVDTQEDSEIMLKIVDDYKLRCDILKTQRGYHFYFLASDDITTQSVGIFNTIGLKCDIGLGSKDRVVPLKTTKMIESLRVINGENVVEHTPVSTTREFIQQYDDLEEIPAIFKPLSKKDYGIKNTDTRNNTLYTYIMTLQYHGFSADDIRKIIKTANKYIIKEPLSDSEIDTITRDGAFSEEIFFTDKGGFIHDRFGNYLLSNANISMIDNQMCIYTKDFIYSNDPDEFERVMVSKIPQLKDSQRKEVYKYMNLKCNKKAEYSPARYIGLKDEILDIQTMETIPYTPQFIINNKIQYDYKADAYCEVMDRTLDKVVCNDPEIRALLEEMIGYTLYRANIMQKCFILTGEGSNGKSTILNLIKKLLGKVNYTSLDLRELEDTFKPAELYNKLANIGDDISAKYLDSSSVFKKVVTGESFMVQKKYAQPFELENYSKQIFCANVLPPVNDRTDGFTRRIIIVPFNAKFSPTDSDYDPFIEDKLMSDEAMEYLLKIAIDGLRRILLTKQFTESKVGNKERERYIKDNNNILEWLDEEPKVKNESVNDVYMEYQLWCSTSGYHAVKKGNFSKEINKQLGLVSKVQRVDGRSIRIYTEEDI